MIIIIITYMYIYIYIILTNVDSRVRARQIRTVRIRTTEHPEPMIPRTCLGLRGSHPLGVQAFLGPAPEFPDSSFPDRAPCFT